MFNLKLKSWYKLNAKHIKIPKIIFYNPNKTLTFDTNIYAILKNKFGIYLHDDYIILFESCKKGNLLYCHILKYTNKLIFIEEIELIFDIKNLTIGPYIDIKIFD